MDEDFLKNITVAAAAIRQRGCLATHYLIDNSTAVLLSVTLGLGIIWAYQFYETKWKYWQKLGIQGVQPYPLVGELYDLLFKSRTEMSLERTQKYGKIYGSFALGKPRLAINDAEIVRQICIKDFDYFTNHGLNQWANKYQKNSLVWLQDEHWKRVRAMMSPTFTSGKIKRMFKLMDSCADDLVDNFREQLERVKRRLRQQQQEQQQNRTRPPSSSSAADHNNAGSLVPPKMVVDLYDTFSLYTLDGITTCCYGIKLKREINSNDNGGGRKSASSSSSRNCLYDECRKATGFSVARAVIMMLLPAWLLRLAGFQLSPESQSRPLMERLKKLIKIRRQLVQVNTKYDDLLQMLVDARLGDQIQLDELDELENHHVNASNSSLLDQQQTIKSGLEGGETTLDQPSQHQASTAKLSDLELLSEASFLLVAGFDTTRSSLSTIVYLLAHHEDIQERLHSELRQIARWQETAIGKHLLFEYDELTSCQYLDAVISESLRYLNPAPFTDRVCKEDYYVDKYKLTIPKGTQVIIGLHSMHWDADYWREPHKFQPDRFFVPELRAQIRPGSYAPFSMGPRHCIGMRFSLTETKLALAKVLMNFKFAPAQGTCFPPKTNFGLGLVHVKDCRVEATARYD